MNTISTLHQNVDQFFENFFNRYQSFMTCAQGCSSCCHTDIGVFSIEANYIVTWFMALPEDKQKLLLKQWNASEDMGACVFLYKGECSIYEARPTICRSQGAMLVTEDKEVDICPKNFSGRDLPSWKEGLALERLNTLLVMGNKLIQDSVFPGERVSLKKVKTHLLECKFS